MANYNEIHEFAEKWIDKYRDQKINYIELVDHYFADDCGRLGFEMDCGKAFTLCGSTRFKEQFMEAQKRLTLEGNIVISVGLFDRSGDPEVWENMDEGTLTATKAILDDMHKRKIDMADSIYVINVGGYIGDSTESEIAYAEATGKKVEYLEEKLCEY